MLLVDAGNSRIKFAMFDDGVLSEHLTVDTDIDQPPRKLFRRDSPGRVVISNVAGSAVAKKIAD